MQTFNIHNNTLYVTLTARAFIGKSWIFNRDIVMRGGPRYWWWVVDDSLTPYDRTPAKMYFSQDTCSDLEKAYQECLTQLIIEE